MVAETGLVTFRSSTLDSNGPVPVLVLRGNFYEQGLAYGVLLRDSVKEVFEKYEQYMSYRISSLPWYLRLFPRQIYHPLVKGLEKSTPEKYLDEIRGLSDGAGVSYEMAACVSYGAYMNFACTSVLSDEMGGEGLFHARNFDYEPFFLGDYPVLICYESEERQRIWGLNVIGYLPFLQGCNEQGISVSINVAGDNASESSGTAIGWRIREVLSSSKNLDDADEILGQEESDQKNWIVTIGSAREQTGAIFDLVNGRPTETRLSSGSPQWAFNCPLEGARKEGQDIAESGIPLSRWISDYNYWRREAFSAHLREHSLSSPEAMWALLRNHDYGGAAWFTGLCTIANDMTLFSMVFDLASNQFTFAWGTSWASLRRVWSFSLEDMQFQEFLPPDPFISTEDFLEIEALYLENSQSMIEGGETFTIDSRMGPYYLQNFEPLEGGFDRYMEILEASCFSYPELPFGWLLLGERFLPVDPERSILIFQQLLKDSNLCDDYRLRAYALLSDAWNAVGDLENARISALKWLRLLEEISGEWMISDVLEETRIRMETRTEI